MNKPTKPNITIPESFAANGVKADFDNNKILNGFDRIQPDVLAGDNLNKFIDDTYKGLNYGIKGVDYLEERWKSQLTNCILEIPQRIKYTLEDGTLTIKAGSVVIVPYGTEDLTSQYPIGATFIHENFKVVDTQFEDGKFFVWAEVQSDIINSDTGSNTNIITNTIHLQDNTIYRHINSESGTATVSSQTYTAYYKTDLNLIRYCTTTTTFEDFEEVISLPILLSVGDGNNYYGSVQKVFNGMGYIGGTYWADKGVKCLMPNGRNADGTLKNLEYTTPKLCIESASLTTLPNRYIFLCLPSYYEKGIYRRLPKCWFIQETQPAFSTEIITWYNPKENIMYNSQQRVDGTWEWIQTPVCFIGAWSMKNGIITNFGSNNTVNLATKDEIDGMWVNKTLTLAESQQANATTETSYDLTDYLPKDGNIYEVIVGVRGYTLPQSAALIDYTVKSSVITASVEILRVIARSAASVDGAGNAIIPIGQDRILTFISGGQFKSATNGLNVYLYGYRKVR